MSAEELRQFLAERVADYKVPRVVHFVAALPRTPSHKLRRHALREELSKTAADGGALFVPSTPEGVVLAKLWRKLLKVDVVRAADSFFDQGADSLTAMTLLSELENECGLILGPAALAEHPTIAGIEAALRSAERVPMPMLRPARALPKSEARSEALGRLRKMLGAWRGTRAHPEALIVGHNLSGTAQPIHFCFDGAGEVYRLAEALGDDQPLYAMRSLWRVDAPAHVAPEIASLYCDEILALQPRGPYAVGGFCAGSSIAQHVATELVRRGAKVSTCLLVDPLDLQAGDYRAGLVVTGFGRLSLYQYYKRPELGLRRLFRGGVNLYRHHCDHQDCFEPPDVALTAKYMQEEIARSGAGLVEHPAQTGGAVLPDGAHRCAIVADVPKRIRRGGRQLVRVTITNTSPVTWGADQVSVCNRWPSLKTKAIRWLKKNLHSTDRVDGSTLISRALQPGESLTLELKIRAPSLPQLAALELDLVEEGICWFQEKTNRRPLRETVVVF